jgi:hypothetical protein
MGPGAAGSGRRQPAVAICLGRRRGHGVDVLRRRQQHAAGGQRPQREAGPDGRNAAEPGRWWQRGQNIRGVAVPHPASRVAAQLGTAVGSSVARRHTHLGRRRAAGHHGKRHAGAGAQHGPGGAYRHGMDARGGCTPAAERRCERDRHVAGAGRRLAGGRRGYGQRPAGGRHCGDRPCADDAAAYARWQPRRLRQLRPVRLVAGHRPAGRPHAQPRLRQRGVAAAAGRGRRVALRRARGWRRGRRRTATDGQRQPDAGRRGGRVRHAGGRYVQSVSRRRRCGRQHPCVCGHTGGVRRHAARGRRQGRLSELRR